MKRSAAFLVAAALAGCTGSPQPNRSESGRIPVAIIRVALEESSLGLSLAVCNDAEERATIVETASTIRLSATTGQAPYLGDCAEGVNLPFSVGLDGRTVADAYDGQVLTCAPPRRGAIVCRRRL